jgi:rhodanese-related sulfurtransferase
MNKITALVAASLFFAIGSVHADDFDPSKLPAAKQTISGKYLSAKQAYEMKTEAPAKVLFVDVRTPAETEYVGMASQVDLNIPYMLDDYLTWDAKKSRFMMSPNSAFTMKIDEALKARGLNQADRIILMCRSGDRSAAAANLLTKAGYTNVYSVYEGFEGDMGKDGASAGRRAVNGWKNAGLPWGYNLDKAKIYTGEM